ncbi:MAG: sugar phosphate isomerase/epimerase [Bryobacterales bacterium]|nr:sugar phosphate isomerase/epimerase [Bryobacterales bacterium]
MRETRRQWLRRTAAAPLGAAFGSPGAGDRLGIFCHLGEGENQARRVLAAARAAGFRRTQIFIPWDRAGEGYLKALPGWLREAGIQAEVLSAYVNCCSPETVLMNCRRTDFEKALEYAGQVGSRCLAAWTGGYGSGLMTADPRNFTPQAGDAIVRFLEPYCRKLESAGLQLALESYITLACPDAPSLRSVLNRLPSCIGAVLDPPNLTPPARYAARDQVLEEMMRVLRGRIALVHLKDFRLAADNRGYELPGPLEGEMNYRLYAKHVLSLPASIPLVAEHIPPEGFAAARRLLREFR